MGYPGYSATNILRTAVITVTSEESKYPKSSLVDGIYQNPHRTTGKIGEQYLFDLGGSSTFYDLIVLLFHNLSSGVVVTVRAGSTSAVSDFSQAAVWRQKDLYIRFPSQVSYRYVRIDIDDGANSDGYIQIGEIWGGLTKVMASHYNFNFRKGREREQEIQRTPGGVTYVEDFHKATIMKISLSDLTDAQMDEWEALENAVEGALQPFVFIPNLAFSEVYLFRSMRPFVKTQASYADARASLEFMEEPMGTLQA